MYLDSRLGRATRSGRSGTTWLCATLLLLIAARGKSARRLADASCLAASHTHHLGVDGCGDGVIDLAVQLRQSVSVEDARLLHITHRRALNEVAHDVAAHRLVLGHHGTRRLASHTLDVSTRIRRLVSSRSTALCNVFVG